MKSVVCFWNIVWFLIQECMIQKCVIHPAFRFKERKMTEYAVIQGFHPADIKSYGYNCEEFHTVTGVIIYLQTRGVMCETSGLINPLKIGTKPHSVSFKKENLSGMKSLVSLCFLPLLSVAIRKVRKIERCTSVSVQLSEGLGWAFHLGAGVAKACLCVRSNARP